MARWVLPTPGGPSSRTFSFFSRKPSEASSATPALSSEGWKAKSKLSSVRRAGKPESLSALRIATALAGGELFLEEPVEQVGVGPGLLLGQVQHAVELLLQGNEAEPAEVVVETLADEFGHAQALPSSAA